MGTGNPKRCSRRRQLSKGVTICSAQSVEHPFLVNYLAGFWENLVLGAVRALVHGYRCGLPCDNCSAPCSQAGPGFSDVTGDSSAGPPEAVGL